MKVHFYDLNTGLFTGASFSGDESLLAQNTPPGCGAAVAVTDWRSQCVDLDTGEVIDWQPPPPADTDLATFEWDAQARRWVGRPTLAAVRQSAWGRIKVERDRRLGGTFKHGGKVFDIDPVNLTAAAFDAQQARAANERWERSWVLHDDTETVLTAADVIAAARACSAAVSALWATSQALREQINDPEKTAADIEAITWPEDKK